MIGPNDGASRLLRRWPGLPILSLGFFMAYVFCLFSNTISASAPRASLIFYSTILIMCIIMALLPGDIAKKLDSKYVMWAAGFICAIGTVLVIDASLQPEVIGQMMTLVGGILCACGISILALKSLILLGRLNITTIWIWMAYIELLIVGLYFAIASSPLFVNMIVLTLLPVFSVGCLNLSYDPRSYFTQEVSPDEKMKVNLSTLVKFFVFVFVLSITSCFAKEISFSAIAEGGLLQDLAWPAWERVCIAIFILAVMVFFAKQFPFSKLCLFAVVMLIVLIVSLSARGEVDALFFFFSTLLHSTLECATMAFAACLIYRMERREVVVSAIALACLYGGLVVGYGSHSFFPLELEDVLLQRFFYATAALSVLISLVFFQERNFDVLLGTIDPENGGRLVDSPISVEEEDTEAKLMDVLKANYMLSPRECEVVTVMKSGKTVNRIAEEMHLSVYTVRGYIQSIYSKCDVHSKDEFLDFLEHMEQ